MKYDNLTIPIDEVSYVLGVGFVRGMEFIFLEGGGISGRAEGVNGVTIWSWSCPSVHWEPIPPRPLAEWLNCNVLSTLGTKRIAGIFHVNPRFHTIDVWDDPGLTWSFQTLEFLPLGFITFRYMGCTFLCLYAKILGVEWRACKLSFPLRSNVRV